MFGNGIGTHSNCGEPNSLLDPSFTSMLQEIFSQTNTEIEECRTHAHAAPYFAKFGLTSPFLVPDETLRFEPLVDPALNYISSILAEEEDQHSSEPCMSMNEYLAYQAKAHEVAALLKQDSPSLTLKVQKQSPLSPDAPSAQSEDSFVSEKIISGPMETISTFHSMENDLTSSSAHSVETSGNELCAVDWPGRPRVELPYHGSTISSENSGKILTNKIVTTSREINQSIDDSGVMHRTHRKPKPDRVLKPRKESSGGRKKSCGKARCSRDGGEPELVDLNDLLLQCAQAVGLNNSKRALEILKKIKQHASPFGNGAQRLAYYFAEALDARFSGTGWPLYLGLLRRRPSPAEVLKATSVFMSTCPFIKVSHYFINQTILNVAKGASRLNILDLQIAGGFNYPSLIKALAERPGGPPIVRLIGIGFPHYSMMPARTETILEGVQKTGRQLSEFAATYGVPFEFIAWAGMRDNLVMQDFVSGNREKDDVLVIISAYLLRYVMDETLDSPSARLRLLKMGQSINPDVYIQGIVTGAYNTPFFTRRFRESLFHFESLYDVLDTFNERENQDRLVFESEILGKALLNIVACEGMEVVERVDKYKHWQAISGEAGFQQLPLSEEIKENVQAMLKTWHKEYTVTEDSQYMLMGWKGRMLHAMSTWKSSA